MEPAVKDSGQINVENIVYYGVAEKGSQELEKLGEIHRREKIWNLSCSFFFKKYFY